VIMGWWSDLLRRLTGDEQREEGESPDVPPPVPSGGHPVFECQSCFKVFESESLRPVCPECESAVVKTLAP